MSITYIPNQPVVFTPDPIDSCAKGIAKYVQLATLNDVTQFQIKIGPCADCESYTQYPTWDGDPWENEFCKESSEFSALFFDLEKPNSYFTWTFTIQSVIGTITISLDGITIITITEPGTYTINFYTTDVTQIKIEGAENTEFCFGDSYGTLCWIPTNYRMTIKDSNDNYVDEIDKAWVIAGDTLTTNIEWSQYPSVAVNSCYYICIADPCVNTDQQNEEDVNLQDYSTLVNNATVVANADTISFSSNTSGSSASVTLNSSNLIDGQCYTITCNTDDLSGVRYRFSHNGSSSPWVFTDGTLFSHSFTYHTGDVLQFQFQQHTLLDPPYTVTLFDIKIQVCASAIVCDCCSNMFKIDSGDCTHLVKVCNDKDAFGFVFNGSQFTPNIRLKSTLVRSKYSAVRETFEDSTGNKNTVYFKRRKSREFRVDPAVAEYVHDFLSTLAGYDHMFIDTLEYFVDDDEYSVTYPTRNDLEAIVSINVSEKVQLVENKMCGDTHEYCSTIDILPKNCNC